MKSVKYVRPICSNLALKNRVGEPATDFTYTLVDGKKRNFCIVRKLIVYSCFSIIRIAMPVRKLRISRCFAVCDGVDQDNKLKNPGCLPG